MSGPHPFARFVVILGRGKSLSRSLTGDEAEEAMSMILEGAARPEQVGAFLMLLRVREETPDEIAGFVRASRKAMRLPSDLPRVNLDWSSYAGKRRQLPWFLLAVRILSANGWRVLIHGADEHTAGRVYTGAALRSLGLPIARDFADAAAGIAATGFAYLPLGVMSSALESLMSLRSVLGLRSPNKSCEVIGIRHGVNFEERWPSLLPEAQQQVDETMDLSRLGAVWRGETQDDYATAAVIGTLAIALKALGAAKDVAEADARAAELWRSRPKAL